MDTKNIFLQNKRLLLLASIVIAGVGLTAFSTYETYISERSLAQHELTDSAEEQTFALEQALVSNIAILKSLAASYSATPDINRYAFNEVADRLLQNSVMQAVEWIPRVPDSKRKRFEQAAQRDGDHIFEIKEMNEQGQLVRARKRNDYFPVYHIEPYKSNEPSTGFDVASSPARLKAIRHSINIGGFAATEGIKLVEEREEPYSFLLFYPVYEPGVLSRSTVPDSSGLRGFVVGVFRVRDVVEKALAGFARKGLLMWIADLDESRSGRLLGAYSNGTGWSVVRDKLPQDRPIMERVIDAGGQSWKIYVTHAGAMVTTNNYLLVLISGFLLTGTLLMLMVSIFRRHAEIEQTVITRTAELKTAHEQFRKLASHLLTFREEERTNIAREIHDELGQILTALKMELYWFRDNCTDRDPTFDKTEAMLHTLDTMILSVKRICAELRPSLLDDFGLVAALEWQAKEFQKRTGIECAVIAESEDIALDNNRSIALFRIFQEALTNVLKHAKATTVTARLTKGSDNIILEVMDNGKGIENEQLFKPQCFGLLGMRERVYPWDGKVEISGDKNRGTTIKVIMPFSAPGALTK
ncbi:MAG: CHASE domain-containing protein [Nitrospirae bacterium]|nr:CHASE domain-containing protein [Nitrospirota bacterium]